MPSSKFRNAPQFVTLQVACDKTPREEKPNPRTMSVTELAFLILGVGCCLTLSATAIAFYARGQLGTGVPKVFSGFQSTLPMSDFLFGTSTESRAESIFVNEPTALHNQEPLPIALASPSDSIATVIRHGLSGSTTVRKKGLMSWGAAYEQAAPPENLSKPSEMELPVTTISPGTASEQSSIQTLAALAPPPAIQAVEELQSWFGKGQPSFGLSFGDVKDWSLLKQVHVFSILIMVVAFSGLSLGLSSVVRKGKSSTSTLDLEVAKAMVKLPLAVGMPNDSDVMEAFDAFDRNRMGFIDRATVNHMLGHMALPGHLDAAAPYLGSVKKLFYEDFRRLAQQPGPFADIVMERVNKRGKRLVTDCKRAAVFDERCKLAAEVDAMQAAINASFENKVSPPTPPQAAFPGGGTAPSARGFRRSWADMRADLAPKTSE